MIETLYITFALLLVAVGIWKWREVELRHFRRDAAVGTLCLFHHKDAMINGHIVACDETHVVINSRFGSFKRERTAIWPR